MYSLVCGPNFANAQCEAVWRRIPLGSVLQASRRGKMPVIVLNAGAFRPATRIRQFEGPIWQNAQCEAVRGRIPPYSGPLALRRVQPIWRKYLIRVPLARRLAFANSRAQFGEMLNARQSVAASRRTQVPLALRGVQPTRRKHLIRVPLARRLAFANSRAQFGEMRNARQSAAASHSAQLPKHQIHIILDGDRVKTGNL